MSFVGPLDHRSAGRMTLNTLVDNTPTADRKKRKAPENSIGNPAPPAKSTNKEKEEHHSLKGNEKREKAEIEST